MGFEWLLILAGVAQLIAVLARRRILQKRLTDNKEALFDLQIKNELPDDVGNILKKAPLLKGDGKFAYTAKSCIPYAANFDSVRIARRIYYVEPTVIEVLLIPNPANIERKFAVAVTVDSKVLGYVPTREAGEMHKYLLAHSSGFRAMAKIYIGSRPEYNGVMLDFAKPLRLESRRR